jgi:hypothetical protein
MKKNELIARLLNRKLTTGASREFCFASAQRNLCFSATANRNLCFSAAGQRAAQATPAK